MSTQQTITDLENAITNALTTGAAATGSAISSALAPTTSAISTTLTGVSSTVGNSVQTLSDSLYDPNNQSGILYDIQNGVQTLGNSVSLGLSSTANEVNKYTSETTDAITNSASYILIGLLILSLSLFVNAYYVNSFERVVRRKQF